MKIHSIKIDGYKNIHNSELELSNFNALVSLNNYGKSNFLEAIEFAINYISAPIKTKALMMQIIDKIPINTETANNDFLFDIEISDLFGKVEYFINYNFSFEWLKKKEMGKKVVKETLRLKKNEKDAKYSTYISRNQRGGFYLPSKTGRCDKKIQISDSNLIVNKLENFDELFYLEILEKINHLNFSFSTSSNIDSYFVTGFFTSRLLNDDKDIDVTEMPCIPKFFYMLKHDDKNLYETLEGAVLNLLPDIEFIEPVEIDLKESNRKNEPKNLPFELPEKVYDIRVKVRTNNQAASVRSLSFGSKKVFYLLYLAILAETLNAKLLTYEELENSIHPALLQRLLIILNDLTPNVQIIVTSHSPNLVKYLDLDSISIGVPNISGTANFKKIKPSKRNKLVSYSTEAESSIGEFIFDMLLEGFSEDSFWIDFI